MQTESLGKVLPRILFPYVQQWAERSGLTLLSRLLVDDQLRELIERYGDEIVTRLAQASHTLEHEGGAGNGRKSATHPEARVSEADANGDDLTNLRDRVLAMEAQQETQQALFELLRSKIRPLALALGCCPECLVGVNGCAKCWGQSKVAHYPPDYTLLEAEVVRPLAARGVPLVLTSRGAASAKKSTVMRKRRKPWPRK